MLKCLNDDTHFTQTREGKIYHLNARVGGFDLTMPVKLKKDTHGSADPDKDKYGYIYALPGGYSINLNGDISRD